MRLLSLYLSLERASETRKVSGQEREREREREREGQDCAFTDGDAFAAGAKTTFSSSSCSSSESGETLKKGSARHGEESKVTLSKLLG